MTGSVWGRGVIGIRSVVRGVDRDPVCCLGKTGCVLLYVRESGSSLLFEGVFAGIVAFWN